MVVALWLAAGSPAAGDVRACFAEAARAEDCIGVTLAECLSEPGGDTTAGMAACIAAETEAWDAILNEEYQATMDELRALDATGDVAAPDLARETTLRDAQRAWIAFRDAECRAQYARWGMGSMRGIAGANCLLTETAERAIELRDMRAP